MGIFVIQTGILTMSINHKITCDNCNSDLTESSNSVDYRIKLYSQRMPCHDGAVFDMLISPQIPEPMHFCGLGCLSIWVKGE